jgi:hypothetical protein
MRVYCPRWIGLGLASVHQSVHPEEEVWDQAVFQASREVWWYQDTLGLGEVQEDPLAGDRALCQESPLTGRSSSAFL